jgi:hypothetical protein
MTDVSGIGTSLFPLQKKSHAHPLVPWPAWQKEPPCELHDLVPGLVCDVSDTPGTRSNHKQMDYCPAGTYEGRGVASWVFHTRYTCSAGLSSADLIASCPWSLGKNMVGW